MSAMSISGLASGLDTSSLLQQMMAIEKRPRVLLDTKQSLIETRQSLLKEFQTKLRSLQLAAADLRSVALYAQTQAVDSGDPTKLTATSTSGAGVGGYQIEVSQLANAAQRTYDYRSPAADGSITIDGRATAIRAGMTAQEVATAINSDRDAAVYAAATGAGTIVFSSRATGDTGAGFISVSDGTGAFTEVAGRARQGRDALFTVDGVAQTSRTNVVGDALAGVTLTLRGVTTASGPITVSVGAPGADTDAITRKVQAFVDAYNSTVELIRGKLDEKAVPDPRSQQDIRNGVPDPRTRVEKTAGSLFGDRALNDLLTNLRQSVYTPVAGMPAGMDSLASLGISTGAVSATTSKDTLAGKLTVDVDKLTRALTADPSGVRNLLQGVNGSGGWARGFEDVIDRATKSDGMLGTRITGADDELKNLKSQMDLMDVRLALRERSLQTQFTALEVAMAKSQSQSAWLTGQLAGLG